MHTYHMLSDGDRILVAVSGGIDSMVLAWVLDFWRSKAPISYEMTAVHIDMDPGEEGPGPAALAVRDNLLNYNISLEILPTRWRPDISAAEDGSRKDVCYTCSRNRRKQLFDYAGGRSFNRIALGHHQDDIIETFFLNICYAGNISTMVPKQDLFGGRLALIRPLSYLDKTDIRTVAERLGVTPVRTSCLLSEQTRRLDVRRILENLYREIPESKKCIFAALANVRSEYLLQGREEDPDSPRREAS